MLRRNSVKDFNTIVTLDSYKLRIGNCELSQNEIVVKSKEVKCVVWYKRRLIMIQRRNSSEAQLSSSHVSSRFIETDRALGSNEFLSC